MGEKEREREKLKSKEGKREKKERESKSGCLQGIDWYGQRRMVHQDFLILLCIILAFDSFIIYIILIKNKVLM